MSPTPKRQPMVECPHCGAMNDPARGSTRCFSCNLPLSQHAPTTPRDQAMRNAGLILAAARARLAASTPDQIAAAAHIPGGPSREQLAARVRELRDQTRRATRAA